MKLATKITIGILVLIVIGISSFLVYNIIPRSETGGSFERLSMLVWWDEDYQKKKEVIITNNIADDVKNYVVNISVTYDTNMQTDFDDLRFLDSTETTELDYWIETVVASTSAHVWVEVPALTGSDTTNIWMYYGNAGASSTANADDTFLFFDDMSGVYSDNWETYNGDGGSFVNLNGVDTLRLGTSDSDWDSVRTKTFITNATNISIDYMVYASGGASSIYSDLGWSKTYGYYRARVRTGVGTNDSIFRSAAPGYTGNHLFDNKDQWYSGLMNSFESNHSFYINDTFVGNLSDASSLTTGPIIFNRYGPVDSYAYITNVTVRPFINPEPTWTFSTENDSSTFFVLSQGNPTLSATTIYNTTSDNLTCYNQSTIGYGSINNIINWYKNNQSLMVLNMPMDINQTDYSPNDYAFTVTGATQVDGGWIGGAYNFTGGDYIVATDKTAGNFTPTSNFSISLWMYYQNTSSAQVISRAGYDSTWQGYIIECIGNGNLQFVIGNGSNSVTNAVTGGCLDKVGVWQMVTATKNDSHLNLYVNGTRIDTDAWTLANGISIDSDDFLHIGSDIWEGRTYNGTLDELRIFDYTLSDAQIKNMYNYEYANQQQYNTIVSEETKPGDIFSCSIDINNMSSTSIIEYSNNLTILGTNVIFEPISNFILISNWGNKILNLSNNVSDEDTIDANLKYTFTNSNPNLLSIDINNQTGELNFTSLGTGVGTTTIDLTVIDEASNTASISFNITVIQRVLQIYNNSYGGQFTINWAYDWDTTNRTTILSNMQTNNITFLFVGIPRTSPNTAWLSQWVADAESYNITLCVDVHFNLNSTHSADNYYPNSDGSYTAFSTWRTYNDHDFGNQTYVTTASKSFASYMKSSNIKCINFNEDPWEYSTDKESGYSQADLEDFRAYNGNATALLPVDTSFTSGTRTINVANIHPLWYSFYSWKKDRHQRYVSSVCSEFKQKVENGTCAYFMNLNWIENHYGNEPGITFVNNSHLDLIIGEQFWAPNEKIFIPALKLLGDEIGVPACGFSNIKIYDGRYLNPLEFISNMLVTSASGGYCTVFYPIDAIIYGTSFGSNGFNQTSLEGFNLGYNIINQGGSDSILNNPKLMYDPNIGIAYDFNSRGSTTQKGHINGLIADYMEYKPVTIYPPITLSKLNNVDTLILSKHSMSSNEWKAVIQFQNEGGNVIYQHQDYLVPSNENSPLQVGGSCLTTQIYRDVVSNMSYLFAAEPNQSIHGGCYENNNGGNDIGIANNSTFITNRSIKGIPEDTKDYYTFLNISAGATSIINMTKDAGSLPILTYYKRNATSGYGIWVGWRARGDTSKSSFGENKILLEQNLLNREITFNDTSILNYIDNLTSDVTEFRFPPLIVSDNFIIFNNFSAGESWTSNGWFIKNNNTQWQIQSLASQGIPLNIETASSSIWQVNGVTTPSLNPDKRYFQTTIPYNTYWHVEARNISNLFDTTIESSGSVYETSKNTFALNVTNIDIGILSTLTATFTYDGISKSVTTTDISTTSKRFTSNVYASPSGDNNWVWNIIYTYANSSTGNDNTNIGTQTVFPISFSICDGLTTEYLNISFKNETSNVWTTGRITLGTFTYGLESELTTTKEYVYTNTTDVFSHMFCFDPINQTVYVNLDLDYTNAIGTAKTYQENDITLTNIATLRTLYLYSGTSGDEVSFQVNDIEGDGINSVLMKVETLIGGIYEEVTSDSTDGDGEVIIFLNNDTSYKFTLTKSGYNTYVDIFTPRLTYYEMVMTRITEEEPNYYQGISWDILPAGDLVINNTAYDFTFALTSSYHTLQEAGFVLFNSTTQLGISSCSSSGGCTSITNVNTLSSSEIIMKYYWVIDGNYTNGSKTWIVSDYSSRSSFSLFLEDMGSLSEVFGEGYKADFTRAMIAFFIIMITVGTLTYTLGIYSRTAILGEVFFMTWLMYLVGFIPEIGIYDGFIVILVGLLFFADLIYEYTR